MRLKKIVDQNRLLIFMQEKLAEMKSKFMTQVTIRVKPCSSSPKNILAESHHHSDETGAILPEPFNVLNNSSEMGLAKQLVITEAGS